MLHNPSLLINEMILFGDTFFFKEEEFIQIKIRLELQL